MTTQNDILAMVVATSTTVFTDSTIDMRDDSNSQVHNAVLVTNVKANDSKVIVETVETASSDTQAVPVVVITTTVRTTDESRVVTTSQGVSNPEIDIQTVGEETVGDDGLFVTTVVSTLTFNGGPAKSFVETITSSSLNIVPPAPEYRHLILKQHLIADYLHGVPGGDVHMTCMELYSLFNVSCVKMSNLLYQTLRYTWDKAEVVEIDADTAKYGIGCFGEIRKVAKLWEATASHYGEKVPTELTPEIIEKALFMMKVFATKIIESEYDRRYLTLRGTSDFEAETWYLQKHEAEEWLNKTGGKTPFLDYLAAEYEMDKTELAEKILVKVEEHTDQVSKLLVDMKKLVKKFKSCSTIWDINILYEDYLGIAMPVVQGITLGRTISETDWNRKPEWKVKGNGYYF